MAEAARKLPIPLSHGVRRRETVPRGLDELGCDWTERRLFATILREPRGLVLVTGAARSGKSTTIAAMAAAFGHASVDDVRSPLDLARAIDRAGDGLVVIGVEARDGWGALVRIADLGVGVEELSCMLRGVVVQRLGIGLCAYCTERRRASPADVAIVGATALEVGEVISHAPGCDACDDTGHTGRAAVFEILARPSDGGTRRSTFARSVVDRLHAGVVDTYEAAALLDGES